MGTHLLSIYASCNTTSIYLFGCVASDFAKNWISTTIQCFIIIIIIVIIIIKMMMIVVSGDDDDDVSCQSRFDKVTRPVIGWIVNFLVSDWSPDWNFEFAKTAVGERICWEQKQRMGLYTSDSITFCNTAEHIRSPWHCTELHCLWFAFRCWACLYRSCWRKIELYAYS